MADQDPKTSARTARQQRQQPPAVRGFLILYNALNAVLWAAVLGRVVLLYALRGQFKVYWGVGEFVKWTQTLAVLEILFSLFGIVRAPLFTTAMQVASRLLLVWGVVNIFPNETAYRLAYSTMLLAWSITEVIRYSFFAVNLGLGSVPGWLQWLRYNTFFVLYPLGISSECWLVATAAGEAYSRSPLFGFFYLAVLVIYVPGAYILYTHMMAQRRKVTKGKAKAI